MTATITERPTQTVETTAAATTTQASAAGTQTDANRLTFAVAMIAVMFAVMVMSVVGAVTGIPTLMFASSVLAAITMGVGIYTGINLLEAR
ncbi:hypothetical protein [Actinomyces oris]|uniref:Uncharacterized protein n=1 Tax=Actinomyces oris TaxID=544580 RepID=A0A1Q8WM08_9ACTO|nr:hypothetical protein [Actinomyces oris]OLO68179.1 hypothetical protein BKH19_12045 [Actinomyces oris]QQC38860.1 hypothetical protein I6I08_08145 [Actinomyces oris]TQD59287.1 hypothetical protein FK267_11950 [Actinomyces oris]